MNTIKILLFAYFSCFAFAKDEPKLMAEGNNITVVVGRDATFVCTVENLGTYKVAWLRVDTQTILTIGPHVITKNHRVAVTRPDPQSWALTLRDARSSDAGQYMCQVNTEPMITQTHLLQVSVPPDIEDTSSGEALARERDSVALHCAASGTPPPVITWRREDNAPITVAGRQVSKWSGEWLNMTGVTRAVSGALLCIASNGVPPSVSKRILLRVLCAPTVRVSQKMIGGYLGDSVVLQCGVEAYPVPVVYWTHLDTSRLANGLKYQAHMKSEGYKHKASLRISNVSRSDIGAYHCRAENALGSAADDVTLYTLVATTKSTSTMTTQETTRTEVISPTSQLHTNAAEETDDPTEQKKFFEDDNLVVVLSQHQMQNLDLSPSS